MHFANGTMQRNYIESKKRVDSVLLAVVIVIRVEMGQQHPRATDALRRVEAPCPGPG